MRKCVGLPIKKKRTFVFQIAWWMYISLLVCWGRAVRTKEILPVEVFGCNVRGPLLSDSLVFLRSPPVLLQIQPTCQMDAMQKHKYYFCINFLVLHCSKYLALLYISYSSLLYDWIYCIYYTCWCEGNTVIFRPQWFKKKNCVPQLTWLPDFGGKT